MNRLTRRDALLGCGAGLSLLAGCSSDSAAPSETDGSESSDPTGDDESAGEEAADDPETEAQGTEDDDGSDEPAEEEDEPEEEDESSDEEDESEGEDEQSIEIIQLRNNSLFPADIYDRTAGVASLLSRPVDTEGREYHATADEWIADRALSVQQQWIDSTDFEEYALVFVEAAGTGDCEDSLAVTDYGQDGDTVTASVEVVQEGDGEVCFQDTYPGAVAKLPVDGRVTDCEVTITDGQGRTTVEPSNPVLDPAVLGHSGRMNGDPPALPEGLSCPDGLERLSPPTDEEVIWGDNLDTDSNHPFALRIPDTESPTFERGETVTIDLRNVSDTTNRTATRRWCSLEVLTDDEGWVEVRAAPDDEQIRYEIPAIAHQPGEGFQWTFTMSEEGVREFLFSGSDIRLCDGLPAGRYRFVFTFRETNIAVEFDLVG